MQNICLACNDRFFYRDGDEDCTKFVCSSCLTTDPKYLAGKWARLRFRILQIDCFTCKYCGQSPLTSANCVLHVDHIIPRKNYVSNSEKNLIACCAVCNYGKMAKELDSKSLTVLNKYIESKGDYQYEYNSKVKE